MKIIVLIFITLLCFACAKEQKEAKVVFYSTSGSYTIEIDGAWAGRITKQAKEVKCGDSPSGIKTVVLPEGSRKVKFISTQGYASKETTINWDSECKTYNVK